MRDYYFGNLTEDRVQFTTGRDIDLTPRQDGPRELLHLPVEVGGKAYPADKVQRSFAYQICKPLELNHRGKRLSPCLCGPIHLPSRKCLLFQLLLHIRLGSGFRGLREVRVIPRSPTGRTQALSAIAADRHSSDARIKRACGDPPLIPWIGHVLPLRRRRSATRSRRP